MPARKGTAATSPKPADFFSRQLKGEQPLTFATAERLYELATEVVGIRPWKIMGDSQLFLVEDPVSGRTCYCSVLGSLGEVFSLHAYVGDESYRFLRKVLAGSQVTSAEFYATHTGVSVEYVQPAEIKPPDRELLRALRHPSGKNVSAPIFRAYRPGYYPWYPTEQEGVTLAACMDALLSLTDMLADDAPDCWPERHVYPYLKPLRQSQREPRYAVELKRVSEPPAPPQSIALDEARLRRILEKDYAVGGVLEADYFNSGMAIGSANERNACVPAGFVADAASGFLFAPQLGEPGQPLAEVLALAIMNAIEELRTLPDEIRVQNKDLQQMLTPLAQRLGIVMRAAKSLPAINEARKAFGAYVRR